MYFISSPTGFEPVQENPSRFQVYRLNHSAKVTYSGVIIHIPTYLYLYLYRYLYSHTYRYKYMSLSSFYKNKLSI